MQQSIKNQISRHHHRHHLRSAQKCTIMEKENTAKESFSNTIFIIDAREQVFYLFFEQIDKSIDRKTGGKIAHKIKFYQLTVDISFFLFTIMETKMLVCSQSIYQ